PHFVDLIEVLHVADEDIDATDVVEVAAGLFDRGLYVLTDLARLRFNIANPGDGPVGAPGRHAGDEYKAAARLDHGRVRKMAARLAEFWWNNLHFRHRAFDYVSLCILSVNRAGVCGMFLFDSRSAPIGFDCNQKPKLDM